MCGSLNPLSVVIRNGVFFFSFFVSPLLKYLNPCKIDKGNQMLLEIKSCSVKEHKKLEEKSGEIPNHMSETHTVEGSVVRLINNTCSCFDKFVIKKGQSFRD